MTLKNTLIDLAFAAGWAEPDTQEAREYWYGVDPAKPEWNNMRNAIIRGGLSLRDIGDGGATIEEIKGLIRATGHVI